MKFFKLTLLLACTAGFLLTGCNKDKENPEVVVTSPAEHSEVHHGDEVHIDATFTDDQELASYHMEIGDAAGEHIHDFDVHLEGNISGATYDFHTDVTIPDSLDVDEFFLHFTVTDAEGKTGTASHALHIHE